MSFEKPLVSVIMANYNCAQFIGEAIDSIIAQTYCNWELVVVDDASTDNSVDVVNGYDDPRIKLIINEENIGAPRSRNIARNASNKNTEYYAILDSDDVSDPYRLEKQVAYMQQNCNISILGTRAVFFSTSINNPVYISKERAGVGYAMSRIPFSSPLIHSSCMIRVNDFDNEELYDESFSSSQDYELFYRVFESKKLISCLPDTLVYYRLRGDSLSHKNSQIDDNTLRVQMKVALLFGIDPVKNNVRAIDMLYDEKKHKTADVFAAVKYCGKLLLSNRKLKLLDQNSLRIEAFRRAYGCLKSSVL